MAELGNWALWCGLGKCASHAFIGQGRYRYVVREGSGNSALWRGWGKCGMDSSGKAVTGTLWAAGPGNSAWWRGWANCVMDSSGKAWTGTAWMAGLRNSAVWRGWGKCVVNSSGKAGTCMVFWQQGRVTWRCGVAGAWLGQLCHGFIRQGRYRYLVGGRVG